MKLKDIKPGMRVRIPGGVYRLGGDQTGTVEPGMRGGPMRRRLTPGIMVVGVIVDGQPNVVHWVPPVRLEEVAP